MSQNFRINYLIITIQKIVQPFDKVNQTVDVIIKVGVYIKNRIENGLDLYLSVIIKHLSLNIVFLFDRVEIKN